MTAFQSTNIDIQGKWCERAKVIGLLVGRGGGNLQRIRRTAGNQTYIRVYDSRQGMDKKAKHEDCDKIYVASKSKQSMTKAVDMLNMDMRSILTGSKSSKPRRLVKVRNEAVGAVIGVGGSMVKSIRNSGGLGCNVFYDKDIASFIVTGNTMAQVERATLKILDVEKQYFKDKQQRWKSKKQVKEDTKSNNSFNTLGDSDTDSEEEPEEPIKQEEPDEIVFNAEEEENPTTLFAWERKMKKKKQEFDKKFLSSNWADDSSDDEF